MELYKLQPAYTDYLWGGTELIHRWNKKPDTKILAESWELSMHESGKSRVASGSAKGAFLSDVITKSDYGTNGQNFGFFPLMVKLINSEKDLSIQVHPSDEYALANEGELGKTEMWYILEAKEGAGIYCGLKQEITPEEYSRRIADNTLTEVLNFFPVKPGESYMIPAGTIHAICAGVVLIEIQQNSNLTYRVFDYNRRDDKGNLRALHIDKAKAVSNLKPYRMKNTQKQVSDHIKQLAANSYFSVYEYVCDGKVSFTVDPRSFVSFTFTQGNGEVNGVAYQKGDSFFAPAGLGEITVTGNSRFVLTKLVKYYIGIDIGGTDIKGAIIDENGLFIAKQKTSSEAHKGGEQVVANIARLIKSLLEKSGLTLEDTEGIGMGIPGIIDGQKGEVVYSNNLRWKNIPIVEMLKQSFPAKMRITNDANAAAVGEVKFGSGKNYHDAILITLGTGLGGGVVLDGKLFEGNQSAGAELGHMVIHMGGEACTCGRNGCLEAYASATALIRDAKKAALKNPDSKMWDLLENRDIDKINARIPFDCRYDDKPAAEVVEHYITYLAEGIANIINIFRPQCIMLGGGVSNERDGLLVPLKEKVAPRIFGAELGPKVEIVIAKLGNDAGVYGAAALLME